MNTLDLFGVSLAFLGAMPPPRPPRPNRDQATWVAALLFLGITVAMVGPMITIWSFHRPYAEAKARCIASGGRVIYGALDGSGPHRCGRPLAETQGPAATSIPVRQAARAD